RPRGAQRSCAPQGIPQDGRRHPGRPGPGGAGRSRPPPLPAGATPGPRRPAPQRRSRTHQAQGGRPTFPHWPTTPFPNKPRPAARRRPARARLGLEALETREVPTVSSALFNGTLFVTGDNSGNTITVDHAGSTTIVNGVGFADSQITGELFIRS